jgi:ribose/xylose/arabinose/galactoside ABC-type transport system permease subunit
MSLIGIIAVMLANNVGDFSAILIPVLAGIVLGLANGSIMAGINGRLGESFMVTYGMQSVLAALALIVSGNLFMMVETTGAYSQIGKGLNPVYVFFALIVICQFVLTKTRFGRNVMFMGSNPNAARLSGINVRLYTMLVFMLCGVVTAMAGTLLPSRVMSANPTAGTGYELDAIAACVVGGISMKGGSGNFVNTLVGVIVIGVLGNALNLLGVTTYPQMIIKGFVIALAVTLDILNKNRLLKRG